MDTRRRSDNRERTGAPQLASPEPDDDLGSETRVVRLGDGKPVEAHRSGRSPVVPISIAGVVVLALVMSAQLQNMSPTGAASPSPTGGTIAVTSPTAAVSPGPSPTMRATPRPTTVPVTPTPRDLRPWIWSPEALPADLGTMSGDNMWAVGDHVVLLNSTFDGDQVHWKVASIAAGFASEVHDVPPAITDLSAGSVVGDQLWFAARVTDPNPAATAWQLVGTTTGGSWEMLGPIDPSAVDGNVGFIGRAGDNWVVETYPPDGSTPVALRWSADGRHWTAAVVPSFTGRVEFMESARLRGTMLVLGRSFTDNQAAHYFILASNVGTTWTRTAIDVPAGRDIGDMACSDDACVVGEFPTEGDVGVRYLFRTSDAATWTKVRVDVPQIEPNAPIMLFRPAGSGFIAMAGYSGEALVSTDGTAWRWLQVKPATADQDLENVANLAVAGDMVLAFAQASSSDVPSALWRGSVSAMLAAP